MVFQKHRISSIFSGEERPMRGRTGFGDFSLLYALLLLASLLVCSLPTIKLIPNVPAPDEVCWVGSALEECLGDICYPVLQN